MLAASACPASGSTLADPCVSMYCCAAVAPPDMAKQGQAAAPADMAAPVQDGGLQSSMQRADNAAAIGKRGSKRSAGDLYQEQPAAALFAELQDQQPQSKRARHLGAAAAAAAHTADAAAAAESEAAPAAYASKTAAAGVASNPGAAAGPSCRAAQGRQQQQQQCGASRRPAATCPMDLDRGPLDDWVHGATAAAAAKPAAHATLQQQQQRGNGQGTATNQQHHQAR